MTAKLPKERQADLKARRIAAGMREFKRWVHADDHAALAALADRLAKRRKRDRSKE